MSQIMSQEVWDGFLTHRLRKGRFTWRSFVAADDFVDSETYHPVVRRLSRGKGIGIPFKTVINKMGTGKKRVVYHFGNPEMAVLKLISHLLYRYDNLFASNCYAFRRGKRASDAIFRLKREIGGRKLWAYKVDIHDYFNSISIPILLPILSRIFIDDPRLYSFFEKLLSDDRTYSGEKLVREKRGVMAGTPTAPFLANVYLMEVDHHFENEGVIYARYSDDILILADTEVELTARKNELLDFFKQYHLEVNPSKEHVYAPGEAIDFLGFSMDGTEVGVSKSTLMKMKGKIRRKARSLHRWVSKAGKDPMLAMKAMVNSFNRKFFEEGDPDTLSWSRWFFPVINSTEGLEEIDHYLQDNIRFLSTGKHNKANYLVRYEDIKALGYRSLVNEYHKFRQNTVYSRPVFSDRDDTFDNIGF